MKRIVALALAASIIGLSSNSQAAEITTIKFDLFGSIENIVAPLAGVNPFSAGMMTLQFTDPYANSHIDASASVAMLSLFMSINPNPIAVVSGSLRLTMTQPAYGGHMGAGYILGAFAGSAIGQGVQNGFKHCIGTGSACLFLANLPNSVIIPIPAQSVPFPITIPNLGPQGTPLAPNPIFIGGFSGGPPYTLQAIRGFGGGLATGSFQLVGTEIGRTKVATGPEPSVFSLLALGALGLAGGVAWTRRRAR